MVKTLTAKDVWYLEGCMIETDKEGSIKAVLAFGKGKNGYVFLSDHEKEIKKVYDELNRIIRISHNRSSELTRLEEENKQLREGKK